MKDPLPSKTNKLYNTCGAPEIPFEILDLRCTEPTTCGILDFEETFCENCRVLREWEKTVQGVKERRRALRARERMEVERRNSNSIFAEQERLAPLLQDLLILRKVFPEEFLGLLEPPRGKEGWLRDFLLDLLGPELEKVFVRKKGGGMNGQ